MAEFSEPGNYARLRFRIVIIQLQQWIRWACDMMKFGRSNGARICVALLGSTTLFFCLLLAFLRLEISSSVGVALGIGFFLATFVSFSAAILFGSDRHLVERREEYEQQLPAARKAWQIHKARLQQECEARRQAQIARKEKELAMIQAEQERKREEEARRQERERDDRPAQAEDTAPDWLLGDGTFALEVVGESHYQRDLERVCGGRTERGEDRIVTACLELEENNSYDRNAVSIAIQGATVGYLSRIDASTFRARLRSERVPGNQFHCQANIRGGWDRGSDDRGFYGVWLDVCLYSRRKKPR